MTTASIATFLPYIWPALLLLAGLAVTMILGKKENAGLSIFQRVIRACFGFARCAHGFACAMDSFYSAYRRGKEEYVIAPDNERLYPSRA